MTKEELNNFLRSLRDATPCQEGASIDVDVEVMYIEDPLNPDSEAQRCRVSINDTYVSVLLTMNQVFFLEDFGLDFEDLIAEYITYCADPTRDVSLETEDGPVVTVYEEVDENDPEEAYVSVAFGDNVVVPDDVSEESVCKFIFPAFNDHYMLRLFESTAVQAKDLVENLYHLCHA